MAPSIGGATAQTSVVSIAPCRLVDTRKAGGPIEAGSIRTFDARGTGGTFAAQGGKAGGCGIPASARAIEATVSVVDPTGSGFVRAFPAGETNATFLNFQGGADISNSGSVTLCQTGCAADSDFRAKVYGSDTDLVIDVSSYTVPPLVAVVNPDGSLARGSGVLASTRLSAGKYEVQFDRDVSTCSWVATIGDPGVGTAGGYVHASLSSKGPDTVWLADGALVNLPFHLQVTC